MFAAQVRGFGTPRAPVRRRGDMTASGPRPVRFADLGLRLASGLVLAAIALRQRLGGRRLGDGFLSRSRWC